MQSDKIIEIESVNGPHAILLQNIMRMVPDRDKSDVALQRLIAFRLRIDGENATREFLMQQIRNMIQSAYKGSLYAYLTEQGSKSTISKY